MTEWNFARSSARAAAKTVLTVSTTCLSSEASVFSWALALKTHGEKIRAKASANTMVSLDDIDETSWCANRINASELHLFPELSKCVAPATETFIHRSCM